MSTVEGLQDLVKSSDPLRAKFTAAIAAASAILALYVGRRIFVPLSVAVLLAFALAPLVAWLRQHRLGRMPSVIAAVLLAAIAIGAVMLFLADQFAQIAAAAPAPHLAGPAPPILAQIHQPMPVWIASGLSLQLINPLTSEGIAILFAAFFLLHKDELAARVTRFAIAGDAQCKSAAIALAARGFGRHLLLRGVFDFGFGALIATGLWYIGVPNPGLWALLSVMLRAVPFVGVPVAAACPLMLAVSIDPTALLVCKTLLLFLSADGALLFAERRLVRPAAVRLSVTAAMTATIGWTCLWGVGGLLLAMPLTLGLAMLGRHFAPLQFLDGLLVEPSAQNRSTKPSRAMTIRITGKPGASADLATQALLLAQRELGQAAFDRERQIRIKEMMDGTLGDLAPKIFPREEHESLALRPWNLAPQWQQDPVLCLAGPGHMDEAAAALLAQALRRKGLNSRVVPFDDATPANLPRLNFSGVQVVCLSCLDPRDGAALRQLVRRLRPHAPSVVTIAGLWGWEGTDLMDAGTLECDLVAARLPEAADRIARLARKACAPMTEPAPSFAPVSLAA